MRAAHTDILDADDAALWAQMRDARTRHNGWRQGAVADVAAAHDTTPEEIAARLDAIRGRLVDAGAVDTYVHFVHPTGPTRLWVASRCARWSRTANRYIAAGYPRYESMTYARNATVAANLIAWSTGPADRALIADAIVAAADDASDAHDENRLVRVRLDDHTRLRVWSTADRHCGFLLESIPDTSSHKLRWAGTPAHAHWIARGVRQVTIDHP